MRVIVFPSAWCLEDVVGVTRVRQHRLLITLALDGLSVSRNTLLYKPSRSILTSSRTERAIVSSMTDGRVDFAFGAISLLCDETNTAVADEEGLFSNEVLDPAQFTDIRLSTRAYLWLR